MFRVRGLGRAAGVRDWRDLLQEAFYRTLIGAADARNGRHWNKKVDLVKHLTEAMRSIASSWKRQFTAEEVNTYLVSQLETYDSEGEPYSPLDHIASGHVLADDGLIDMDERDRIFATLRHDADASRVLEGGIDGLKKNEILPRYDLDQKRDAAAVRRIRLKLLGKRVGTMGFKQRHNEGIERIMNQLSESVLGLSNDDIVGEVSEAVHDPEQAAKRVRLQAPLQALEKVNLCLSNLGHTINPWNWQCGPLAYHNSCLHCGLSVSFTLTTAEIRGSAVERACGASEFSFRQTGTIS
jgi:hypothetical protein